MEKSGLGWDASGGFATSPKATERGILGGGLAMSYEEIRRTPRRPLSVPVRIFGQDVKARDFTEDTATLVINWHGALIAVPRPLVDGQTLLVINRKNNKESDFRVVGKRTNEILHVEGWGMECLSPELDFWDLAGY